MLQDKLVDYISSSTALNVRQFLATHPAEVNILCFSYGDSYQRSKGLLELAEGELFAGPISSNDSPEPSFQDMIRAPVLPPKSVFIRSLVNRGPTGTFLVP